MTIEPRLIPSRGVSLHVEVSGIGPALIFGHGMFCNCRMFDRVAPRFVDTHRVVTLDFPGHGKSGEPADPMSLDGLAEDYRAVMDTLGIDRAVVVGFSMGGMAAMRFAVDRPQRLHGLALLNTTAIAQLFHEKQAMKAMGALTAHIGHHPAAVRSAAKLMFSELYMNAHPDVVEDWCEHLSGIRPEIVAEITRMIAERDSFVSRLPEIHVPTLVIGSTGDTATPPRHAHTLARHLADVRLYIFDTGHATPLECPDQVVDKLYAFLAEIGH